MKIQVDDHVFSGIGKLKEYLKYILNSYSINQEVSKEDLRFIISCMNLTEHGKKKIGTGVSKITVDDNHLGSKGFTVHRTDGSFDDFSYKKIVPGTNRKQHSNHEKDVIQAFRNSIRPMYATTGNHFHHEGKTFNEIYNEFIKENGLDPETMELSKCLHGMKQIKNPEIRREFIAYHDKEAVLIEMSAEEHLLIHCPNCRKHD